MRPLGASIRLISCNLNNFTELAIAIINPIMYSGQLHADVAITFNLYIDI